MKNLAKLKSEAEGKLKVVTDIFTQRDGKTSCDPLVKEFAGKLYCRIFVKTAGHPFNDEFDSQLLVGNLYNQGGFSDIHCSLSPKKDELLLRAIYDGDNKFGFRPDEVTIGELVRFVRKHRANFPLGMKTKISLGDFEGNSYHRKVAIGCDDKRLYLSHEANERGGG